MAKRARENDASIVKVNDVAVDPQPEARPATPPEPPRLPPGPPPDTSIGPGFGERLGRFFRFLFRLLLLLLLLVAIGVGLYFALPWLYQRYVVPVERNTADMVELQARLTESEQQLADLQTRLGTLEAVQNQHDQSLTDLDERVVDLETEIAARSESLVALEEIQAELEAGNQAISAELERQITLLKSMELLSRARLFLYESNFGLARQDVQTARNLLASVEADASTTLGNELGEVIFRLDMTLSKLPDFPVAASDDLDIAWQILLSGMPPLTGTVTPTPTPTQAGPASPTAQATVQPTVTP